jgi:hypothetical protein
MNSNRTRSIVAAFCISLLLGCIGCEQAPSSPPQQTVKAPPPPPPPPPPTAPSSSPAAQTPAAPTAPGSQPASKPDNAGSKKAEVGVGKSYSRLSKSLICTHFAALYCVRERMVFEVQIPEAMKLFKATEDRNPKSQAEFMEKIIKANQIHLPELWEGETYRYDPKTGELWVDPPPQK